MAQTFVQSGDDVVKFLKDQHNLIKDMFEEVFSASDSKAREKAFKEQLRQTEEEFTAKTQSLRDAEQALKDKQLELVKLNAEQGTTVFLTSHDVSDIEQVARRVIVINGGALIYDDRVSRMRRGVLSTKLLDVRFEQPPAPGSLDFDGMQVIKESGLGYKLVVDTERRSIREVLDTLLDTQPVADISVLDPPLEDVIARIYERRPS